MLQNTFYSNVIHLFGLKSIPQTNILYILNKNFKNNSICTCDNKQMIRIDDIRYMPRNNQKKQFLHFHPLNNLKESCSYLLMDDSIHLYLRNLAFNIFKKIITTKDGTIINNTGNISLPNMFDTHQLNTLSNPSKNTKYKFSNLFNIVSATSFAKNLIRFEIDFANSSQYAKVNFKYPLYDMLREIQNNTIFGIYLEDNEIKLFKQIYENYIITRIDNLFQEPINISKKSDQYPKYYMLATIKLMLEESYWKKYNICFIDCKRMIPEYKKMLSGLNHYNQYDEFRYFEHIYTESDQKFDQEAYRNEIQIRKESEPNWLLLKDDKMAKKKQQPAVIEDNNKGQIMDNFGYLIEYDLKQYKNKIRKFNAEILTQQYSDNYQQFRNNQEWNEIFHWQNIVLALLYNTSGDLWYDNRIKKYCFRSKSNSSIVNVDSNELGDLLTRALREKITDYLNYNDNTFLSNYAIEIVLVSKLNGINKQRLNINEKADNVIKILVFENEIKAIYDDVFDTNFFHEFFKDNADLFYTRNRFLPNEYLMKKYQRKLSVTTGSSEQTFIENFIYHLVKEKQELFDYTMNWLAYYFQNLQKSKTALVLLGEQEVTQGIFWNIIIKEIFSQQYCTTINDKEYDTASVASIAKDKLFFHIGDIVDADTKFDDKVLSSIIKNLLIKPSVTTDTGEEISIHGQMIITAENPAPYLKKVLSKCTVVEVNNIDTILEKLNLEDEAELEDMIRGDLHNFTDQLLEYRVIIDKASTRADTEARQTLKSNKSSNINNEDIDNEIDAFIQAIKDKNISYFAKVKDLSDSTIYAHLESAFNKDDGYFIGQDLLKYYNAIHVQHFSNKTKLMDRVKEKDEMFKQEVKTFKIQTEEGEEKVLFQAPSTTKEEGNKELYKIDKYTMAKDIIIPSGATIITSQTAYQKYSFANEEDKDNCIARTEEYRENKAKKKEKK